MVNVDLDMCVWRLQSLHTGRYMGGLPKPGHTSKIDIFRGNKSFPEKGHFDKNPWIHPTG